MGYHPGAALSYGAYADAGAYLLALIALIGSFRLIVPAWTWPLWLLRLPWMLPGRQWRLDGSVLWTLLSHDLWPASLLRGDWMAYGQWLHQVVQTGIIPGLRQTLLLSALALAVRAVSGRLGQAGGHAGLLVLRATPEYLLAYLLLLWGPSMLPTIVALMLHNAAIIAFLVTRTADRLPQRPDPVPGLNHYFWNVLPRLFGPFLAYLFYRWEIILGESAVVGILGVYTLGFYIDSVLAELRLERLLPLPVATVLLNVAVDSPSRRLRRGLTLDQHLAQTSAAQRS